MDVFPGVIWVLPSVSCHIVQVSILFGIGYQIAMRDHARFGQASGAAAKVEKGRSEAPVKSMDHERLTAVLTFELTHRVGRFSPTGAPHVPIDRQWKELLHCLQAGILSLPKAQLLAQLFSPGEGDPHP